MPERFDELLSEVVDSAANAARSPGAAAARERGRQRRNRRRVLVSALSLILVGGAGTAAAVSVGHPSGVPAENGTASASRGVTASPSSAVSPSPTPHTSGSSPASRASAPAGVQDLVVSASVRRELTAAYVAFMRFKPSGIAGTAPNSVYYAEDAATHTYWAMATFVPSAAALHSSPGSALFNELVELQDGGNQGMFTRTSGGAWQVQHANGPPQCQIVKFFPKAVITAWALNLLPCPAAD